MAGCEFSTGPGAVAIGLLVDHEPVKESVYF